MKRLSTLTTVVLLCLGSNALVMATYTLSRNDLQALSERLMNRARSAVMDNMPETQKDMKLAALFLQHVAALGMPVGVVVLTYENGLNT